MATSTIPHGDSLDVAAEDHDVLEYRAIHSGAVVGLLLALLSVSLLFSTDHFSQTLALVPIPLVGLFVSLRSWFKIRRERELYTGGKLALVGAVLAAVFMVGGVGRAGYIYTTEVPEGYERISFFSLKPSQLDERADKPIPDEIAALLGKRVFIKGYIRPDSTESRRGISNFLLVRDNNECCFGDMQKVKYFDQMAVSLVPPLTTDFSRKLFRVGGRLICIPQNLGRGPEYPVYALEADHIE